MKGKKEILADILFNSKLVNLFKRLPLRNKLIVLNYHRLRPDDPSFTTPFDDEVFNLDVGEFEKQIRWLKNNTLILSEEDLLALHTQEGFQTPASSRPCVLITFDDGYRDIYTRAFPILTAYQVPAILFVATNMVEDRQMAWWDIIAYFLKKTTKKALQLYEREFALPGERNEAIHYFQQQMKVRQYEHSQYLLRDLSEACQVSFPSQELQAREILSWEEVRLLAEGGIAIGSHTHTHRVMSTIDANAQREEMILSKIILEEQLGRPINSISYPVGEEHFLSSDTAAIAEATGYRLGFTTNTGVNDWRGIRALKVRRIARMLEKVSTVSLLTILPELFTWDTAAYFAVKTMENHPTYADSYYRLGIIHLGQGKTERAITCFRQALEFNPDYIEARLKLGISLAFAGHFDQARENLLKLLEKKPNFADVHYYLGIVQASRKELAAALSHLEKAVTINPAYKDAILKLGLLWVQNGEYARGWKMFARAHELDPGDLDLANLVNQGRKIIAGGQNLKETLPALIASFFGGTTNMDEIIQKFVTHLHISPNLSDIMAIVEKGTFPEENLKNILDLFNDYRVMFPEYSDIAFILGIINAKMGDSGEAERFFQEALRLNPNYVKARLALLNLYRQNGRHREALAEGYLLDRLNLPYPDLYCHLAQVAAALGNLMESKRFADKALAINPALARKLLAGLSPVAGGGP